MPRLWDINGKGQREYMEEMITLAPLQIQSIHLKGYGKHHNLRTLLSVLCEFFVRYSKFWTQMYLIIYILWTGKFSSEKLVKRHWWDY
jgi:hypothetical protein